MAPSKVIPPAAESSSDEEEEEVMPSPKLTTPKSVVDSSEEESEDDEEEVMPSPKPTTPKAAVVDSSEEESEDDDDASTKQAVTAIEEGVISKKRQREDDDIIDSEKIRKKLFQRLFTEQDEITILEGINDYMVKNDGKSPLTDIEGFFNLINDSLECQANPTKLKDKIQRLKKKYSKNSIKKGTECSFKKPHDQISFDLSKRIWATTTTKTKVKAKTVLKPEAGASGVKKFDVGCHMFDDDNDIVKSFGKIAVDAKGELGDRWRAMHIQQLKLLIEQTKLKLEMAELALEVAKSTDTC
ncbi:hypothetical protein ACFE04_019913 [Oxalis oulophora]